MKLGITADWHLMEGLGVSAPCPHYGSVRLREIHDAIHSGLNIFSKEGVRAILHAGDIVDAKRSIPLPVLKTAIGLIRNAPTVMFDVTSNHGAWRATPSTDIFTLLTGKEFSGGFDMPSVLAEAIPFNPPEKGFYHANVFAKPFTTLFGKGKLAVIGIPFRPDSDIDQFYVDCKRAKEIYESDVNKKSYADVDVTVVMIHQGIKEAKLKNAPVGLEKNITAKKLLKFFKFADLIVAGHFHDPQQLHERLIIPGAICQHSFRDCGGKRGVWVWDSETREAIFHKIKSPRFHVIEFAELKERREFIKEGDYVRVVVLKGSQVEKARKLLKKTDMNLSFTTKPVQKVQELRDSTMTFTVGDYDLLTKYVANRGAEDLDKKLLKKYGKKIISSVTQD